MPMWGYYGAGGMGWWMILSSLFWLILAAIAVWAIVRWLSSASSRTKVPDSPQGPAQASALEILKARYARGEIDTATFQAMRAQLEDTTSAAGQTPQEPVSGRR